MRFRSTPLLNLRLADTSPAAVRQGVFQAFALAGQWIQSHRRVCGGVAVALAVGTGATAFAVATFVPDPASVPVVQLFQPVQATGLAEQGDALLAHSFVLYRSDQTRASDSVEGLLARMGIVDAAASAYIRADPLARNSLLARSGRVVQAHATEGNGLRQLSARWVVDGERTFKRLVIEKSGTGPGFSSRVEQGELQAVQRMASGTIRSSLFAATDEAKIPDAVAVQIAEVFSGDIDFHRALRKGDRFSVVYEALEADGEPMRTGRVVSAEFVNNGKTHSALWFQEPVNTASSQAKGGYYTFEGNSLKKAYLASPLEFSRITSGFKMRFHPILQKWRAHLGVDYAAPTGTPIRAVGDGVVEFAGWQNGYGNVVSVSHRSGHATLYAHMSRVNVRKGQSVSQGQNIGLVGATGWATGPHLHFEFRINGAHQDPLQIAKQSETVPLSGAAMPAFKSYARGVRRDLTAASWVTVASSQ